MALNLDLRERLTAMKIDAEAIGILRELRPLVEQHIDDVVTAAYAHFMSFPELQKVYGEIGLDAAKRAQRQHWLEDVFPATFTDAKVANTIRLATERYRSGPRLQWYFVFWGMMFDGLSRAVVAAHRRRPDRLERMLPALCRAVLFDLELFTAVYVDGAESASAALLNQRADDFERDVSAVVRTVAESTNRMQGEARAMASTAQQTAARATEAVELGRQAGDNARAVIGATEALSTAVRDIGEQVSRSTQIASTAVDEARRTDSMVRGLAEAGGRIGDVVQLIKNIASQTNLLRLYATG
jgi:hypothetical protein